MVRLRRGGLLLAGLVLLVPVVASAETATPVPTIDVPSPELCDAEPISWERYAAIASPVAAGAATPTPLVGGTPGLYPAGTPATDQVVDGVVATVRQWVACQNTGEPLRLYAMATDAYLNRLFARESITRAGFDALATPMPEPPGRYTAILSICDIGMVDGSHAFATVTLQFASVPMPKTFRFAFAREGEDGPWMVDGVLGEISFSVP